MDNHSIFGVPLEVWAILGPFIGGLIGALISFTGLLFTSSKRINADLKAKTRLEWIREVRILTVDIIDHYYIIDELHTEVTFFKMANFEMAPWRTKEYKKIKKELMILSKKVTLYKLYFSKIKRNEARVYQQNTDNIKMHKWVDEVYHEAKEFKEHLQSPHSRTRQLANNNVIENFRNETSNYIKREWDRAKANK